MSWTEEPKLELQTIKKCRILRRRNERMKIQFNLTKAEGEAFKNFFNVVNQSGLSEEEFTKTAFMVGLQSMERAIIQRMSEEAEKAQAEAATEEPEIVEDETEETEE
jgi:hypothetical protein